MLTRTSPAAARVLLVVGVALAAAPLAAQTAYHVHPAGDDSASGKSAAAAFASIARGIAALAPGDTLLLGDGVYREVDLVVEGLHATPERPTVIKSVTTWGAKVEGTTWHTVLFKVLDCSHLVLDGLEVYHPGTTPDTDWATGIEVFDSHHVTVRECYSHDCGCGGFGGRNGDYFTFERNVAVGNAMTSPYNCSGISIYHPKQLDDAPGPHIVVRDNVTFGNACRLPFSVAGFTAPTDGNGIILDDYANDQPDIDPEGSANAAYEAVTLVEGNLSFGNGGAGVKTYKVPNAIVRGNTAYHNNYVLAEYGGSVAEIGFEFVDGHVEARDNIAVQAFGRDARAFYFAPWPGREPQATLAATGNVLAGEVLVRGAELDPLANDVASADRQAYVAFADARDTVRAFASVDEFRAYFSLRPGSPAVGADGVAAAGAFAEPLASDVALPPDPVLRARAESTPAAMRVDGVRDGFYTARPQALTKRVAGAATTPADLSAHWQAAYTADTLYVSVDVRDDAVMPGDHVAVYLDGGVPAAAPSSGPLRLRLPAHVPAPAEVPIGMPHAQARTDGGYGVEVAVPAAALGRDRFADADTLGFEVTVVDVDSATPADVPTQLTWRANDLAFETDPAEFGRLQLKTVAPPPAIARAAAAPTVDGRVDGAWAAATPHAIAFELAAGFADSLDGSATWRALWDDEALYVLVEVRDDSLSQDSDAWYDDDGVEVYLDADNAKAFMDYDANDFQIAVGLDGAARDVKGHLGAGLASAVEPTDGGYVVELAVPWSATGVAVGPGSFLGLDLHLVDDDSGGTRDGKRSWFAERDDSHSNAGLFGVVYLAGE